MILLLTRYHVAPRDFTHGGEASSKVKRALERLGANPSLVRRLAITAYEAEMNLVIHATNGGELRVEVSPNRITLITEDDGPGIGDIDQAFAPGFTTALDWVRELGFGAGMGLTNIKRYSDSVDVESAQGRGTKLWAVFLVGNQA
jgi:anti-sigma regulatory factor (Ser/Thr protein kinase)